MNTKILIVDDDEAVRDTLRNGIERKGYICGEAYDYTSARAEIETDEYSLIVCDKNMPSENGGVEGGLDVLRFAKKYDPTIEVIMVTGYATVESVIESLRNGAFDYILKPFSLEELIEMIERIRLFQQFVNRDNIMRIYKSMRGELMELITAREMPEDEVIKRFIESLNHKIDYLFTMLKNFEGIILEQRDSMSRLASYAEELYEVIPDEGHTRQKQLALKIVEQANKRI